MIESFFVDRNTSLLMNVLSADVIDDLFLKDIVRQEVTTTCCLHYPQIQASRTPVCLSFPW